MTSRKRIVGLGLIAVVVGTACGVSSLGGPPRATDEPTPEPTDMPMVPVSINQGLASLNSYRMTYTSDIFDSVSQDRSEMTFIVARDRDSDASYNRTETRVTNGESQDASEDVQEQFAIGSQLCLVNGDDVQMTSVSETARVLSDLMAQVVVIQPLIENPVYAGEEVVNGVPARTYTFDVRSIDAASGVEATRSGGSYAIAIDGDYLLRYRLDMELRTGAEGDSEAQYSTFLVEVGLEQINQPVDIAFPASCLAAGSSGE